MYVKLAKKKETAVNRAKLRDAKIAQDPEEMSPGSRFILAARRNRSRYNDVSSRANRKASKITKSLEKKRNEKFYLKRSKQRVDKNAHIDVDYLTLMEDELLNDDIHYMLDCSHNHYKHASVQAQIQEQELLDLQHEELSALIDIIDSKEWCLRNNVINLDFFGRKGNDQELKQEICEDVERMVKLNEQCYDTQGRILLLKTSNENWYHYQLSSWFSDIKYGQIEQQKRRLAIGGY